MGAERRQLEDRVYELQFDLEKKADTIRQLQQRNKQLQEQIGGEPSLGAAVPDEGAPGELDIFPGKQERFRQPPEPDESGGAEPPVPGALPDPVAPKPKTATDSEKTGEETQTPPDAVSPTEPDNKPASESQSRRGPLRPAWVGRKPKPAIPKAIETREPARQAQLPDWTPYR